MFILNRQIWGPLAGVATALLLVLVLGMNSDVPGEPAGAAPERVQTAGLARNH